MNLLRNMVIVMSLVLTSCAGTTLKSPEVSYKVDKENSLIVGKADFIYNQRKTDYSGRALFVTKTIVHHLNNFTTLEELNRETFFPTADYSFEVTYDDKGYFAFVLPPGKYYFLQFDYWGIIPGRGLQSAEAFRTYMSLPGFREIKRPYLITIEILPNSVSYIGTIKHRVNRYSRRDYRFWIEIVDEYEDTNKWFTNSRFSTDKDLVKNIATVTYIISDKLPSPPNSITSE